MNDLAQLECYNLGCVFLTSRDIIIVIRQSYSYQTTRTVKDWCRSGQARMTTRRQVDCIDGICIDDICSERLPKVPDE